MVGISNQKKRAEGQEFSGRVYLKSFPVSVTYKKLLVKGGKTEQPAPVAVTSTGDGQVSSSGSILALN